MIGLPSDSWNHLGRKRTSRGIFAPLSATQVEAMDVDDIALKPAAEEPKRDRGIVVEAVKLHDES